MNIIQHAGNGDVKFLKTVLREDLLKARDSIGYTALHWAIRRSQEDCCQEICRKCPELVWEQKNVQNHSALQLAVTRGNINMSTFVVDAATKFPAKDDVIIDSGGRKVNRSILRLLDKDNRSPLWYAVHFILYDVTKFLLELDHEFTLGSDAESASAIAKVTDAANRGNLNAARIRDLLIQTRNSHPQVSMEEQNWTELQKAASTGDVSAVREMIQLNPGQLDVVDEEKQNFVHIAARFGQTEIMKLILKEADIAATVLNAQDLNGNTPLHVAVLSGNPSIALLLLYDGRVIKNKVNSKGQKALELVNFEYDREKAKDTVYSWSKHN